VFSKQRIYPSSIPFFLKSSLIEKNWSCYTKAKSKRFFNLKYFVASSDWFWGCGVYAMANASDFNKAEGNTSK